MGQFGENPDAGSVGHGSICHDSPAGDLDEAQAAADFLVAIGYAKDAR